VEHERLEKPLSQSYLGILSLCDNLGLEVAFLVPLTVDLSRDTSTLALLLSLGLDSLHMLVILVIVFVGGGLRA
jgi:hypothetical protein